MDRLHRQVPALVAAVAVLWTAPSRSEWLTARHDPQRTGVSDRPSDIIKPAKYWRSYLGGALGSISLLLGDANTDGELDVLYVAGGKLILARPDGSALWQTASLGFVAIADTVDLDLDGSAEVIAISASQAAVIDGRTGAFLWLQDPDEMGTLTATRLADFDGDGGLDLFLDGCGSCCAVATRSPGVVYSFGGGLRAPRRIGSPPERQRCNSAADTVGDWDGDSTPDLLVPGINTLLLVRGDGDVLGESAPLSSFIGGSRCEAVPLDDVPGDEAVCMHNSIVGDQGSRRVFVLTYRPLESPPVKLVWEASLAPATNGDLRVPTRLVWDLDGDGRREVIASGKNAAGWTTFVLDALTGAPRARLSGELAQAVTPAAGGAPTYIVTSRSDTVSGYRFSPSAPPEQALVRGFMLSGRQIPAQQDRSHGRISNMNLAPVAADLDGDGRVELVLQSTAEPTSLHAYELGPDSASGEATYAMDDGIGIAALSVWTGVDARVRLAVSRNDGYVALLDGAFATLNAGQEGKEILPGMRAGAYYTGSGALFSFGRAPLAASLSPGAPASVLVVDARGDLVRVDAAQASNVSPAKPTWRVQDAFGAGVASGQLGGEARIGCFRRGHPVTEPPSFVLASLSADGEQLAAAPVDKPPAWDVLPGDLDGDGSVDFAAVTVDGTLGVELVAVRGSGQPLWKRGFASSHGTAPAALTDWNGNGTDDVIVAVNTARVHAGESGDLLADGGEFLAYFMPLLADVTGDGVPEVTLQGGQYPARTVTRDLVTRLWQGPDDRPYPYGALAPCPSGAKLVEGSLSFPSRLSITSAGGVAVGQRLSMVLAGGRSFADETEATVQQVRLGQLGDVAVSSNLTGSDSTSTALVGSTDGFLYAVDACTGLLRWSHDFGAPVGAPILGDTDGDGLDDIVVSAADGYLYGLRHEVLPAPERVWDIDIPGGRTAEDLDEITTRDSLHVMWSPVPGAQSYEVAVVGAAGTYLTSPPWTDVGDVTRASIGNLPLDDGAKYYVGVRALAGAGTSPDRPSDGVIVQLAPESGEGGAGGGGAGAGGAAERPDEVLLYGRGCVCQAVGGAGGAGGGAAGLMAAGAAAAAGLLRRRERRDSAANKAGASANSAPRREARRGSESGS